MKKAGRKEPTSPKDEVGNCLISEACSVISDAREGPASTVTRGRRRKSPARVVHLRRDPHMMGPEGHHRTKGTTTMGDKSPKAARKQASQKQVKADRVDEKKRRDVAANQAPANNKR